MRIKSLSIILFSFIAAILFLCLRAPATEQDKKIAPQRAITELEMQTLAEAMEIVYLDTGYYVSIENLNDLLSYHTVHDFDNIDQFIGTWVVDPSTALFYPDKVELTHVPHLWLGPYVTYQDDRIALDGGGYDRGTLLDLWGTPYYLFSPAGLVRTDQHIVTLELYGDYFDSYAIVSLGPDGIKSADDIVRTFGAPPTRLVLTSLSAPGAYPGDTIALCGYNFGSRSRQAPELFLGVAPVSSILSWTDRLIEFMVPEGASSGYIKVVKESEESNLLYLNILEQPTRANTWRLYE